MRVGIVGVLSTWFLGAGAMAMPPEPGKLMEALKARGKIPANATADQATAALKAYLGTKFPSGMNEKGNPKALADLKRNEASGKPKQRHGQLRPNNKRFDNVLTFLVEFGTDATGSGPLHNQIAKPPAGDNTTFWVPDFSPAHYQNMLFNKDPKARSMYTYYLEQSGGSYTVDGTVTAWVKVDHPESFYGADAATGNDNANGPVFRVVADAVKKLGCSINWLDYDKQDPYDLDGDGNLEEPDGFVDHIQFVHAGAGQEAGGGAQGDDAIWSHSWWVQTEAGPYPGWPGAKPCPTMNVWVGPYTINPEDGTIGVFTHEFAHDLGLPDQYDTIYSGESSTGFWTLMSSGSWLGCKGQALGTCPSGLNAWEKWVLGWLDPVVVEPGQTLNNVNLKNATSSGLSHKAIRVLLPGYGYTVTVNQPHSGSYEWYSGAGDSLDRKLQQSASFAVSTAADKLSFWAWYDIEVDWDYGYVEVSSDGGATWTGLAGNITTTTSPNGQNFGNGITGTSNGWVAAEFSLAAYVGKTVSFRFRYWTDAYVQQKGFAVDDVRVTIGGADVLFDDVEAGVGGFVGDWTRSTGSTQGTANHYYMMEWRAAEGFDVSMENWYNYVGDGKAEFFKGSPGMLVWYRNLRYADNHVGVHPWAGQLLLVDARPKLVHAGPYFGAPARTRVQICDAAFGTTPVPQQTLTTWYGYDFPTTLPASAGVATFDDKVTYVDRMYEPYLNMGYLGINESISSVDTPTYGLLATVVGGSKTGGSVNVDFSGFLGAVANPLTVQPELPQTGCAIGGSEPAPLGALALLGLVVGIALAVRRRRR